MRTVILAGSLIDGTGRPPLRGAAVVLDGERIAAVNTTPGRSEARGDRVIDCTHLTVLPGMIDAHVHLTFSAGADHEEIIRRLVAESEAALALRGLANAQAALRAGVTTVRDCGGRGLTTLAVRDAIARGMVAGPRILASGMPITTTAGHLHYCGLVADSPDELRKAVRSMCQAGVDFIKVCATGGMMTAGSNPLAPQYTVEELRTAADEAHRLGRPIAAHILNTEAIRSCLAAGIDTFEHCLFMDPDGQARYDADLGAELARSRRYIGVTASGILRRLLPSHDDPPDERARKAAALDDRFGPERAMRTAGVPMMLHTDAGVRFTPFSEFGRALEVAVAGMKISPLDAIGMVTRAPAEGLGLTDLGTVETGKRADLVAVAGDPSSDVADIARVESVWQNGRLVVDGGRVSGGWTSES